MFDFLYRRVRDAYSEYRLILPGPLSRPQHIGGAWWATAAGEGSRSSQVDPPVWDAACSPGDHHGEPGPNGADSALSSSPGTLDMQ